MTIVVWLLLAVVALKLIWNLGVPFVLLKRLRANPNGPTSRISMSSGVEVVLLLIAAGASALSEGPSWVNRPLVVLGWGFASVVLTYLHLVVVGSLGGWLITRKLPPTPDSPSSTPRGS
jgi:hypothetical protein